MPVTFTNRPSYPVTGRSPSSTRRERSLRNRTAVKSVRWSLPKFR
ncbi:MAG: hypothetical protein ACWGSD_00660 [Thermodesulfobacteriota bacterium]